MKFLTKPIKSKSDIVKYIDRLYKKGMLYHFEDDAFDIVNFQKLPEETLHLLNTRTEEALNIDYDYSLEYICEKLEI